MPTLSLTLEKGVCVGKGGGGGGEIGGGTRAIFGCG